jgi:threonyl-tRNA synthetase
MIHRAPFGSLERFMAILIEQCAGDFPLWLAPEQVVVIPVADKFLNYAEKVCNLLNNSEIRTSVDNRNEKIGKKIRDAEIQKTPYMVIVGEKEENENLISARRHKLGDIGTFSVEAFLKRLNEELTID